MTYTTTDKRLVFETEVKSMKEAMEVVSDIQEVFEQTHCGGRDLRYIVRTTKDDSKFYEVKCRKCGLLLGFGQSKKGDKIYAKRVNHKTKEKIGDYGWAKQQYGENQMSDED